MRGPAIAPVRAALFFALFRFAPGIAGIAKRDISTKICALRIYLG